MFAMGKPFLCRISEYVNVAGALTRHQVAS
jgi:hypothetical protein